MVGDTILIKDISINGNDELKNASNLSKELTDNTANFKTELLRVFELIGYDMSNINSDYLIRTIQEDSPENITEAILDAYCMCECLEYLPYY